MLLVQARSIPMRSPVKRTRHVKHGHTFDPAELCAAWRSIGKKSTTLAGDVMHVPSNARQSKCTIIHLCSLRSISARTATPELWSKREIHKLSRPVLQPGKKPVGSLSPAQFVQQQERARLKMEAAAERNQFQLTKVLEDALISDKARNINKSQQRGFGFALLTSNPRSKTIRDPPTSPEDIVNSDLSNVGREIPPKHNYAIHQPNDRHD